MDVIPNLRPDDVTRLPLPFVMDMLKAKVELEQKKAEERKRAEDRAKAAHQGTGKTKGGVY